MEGRGTTTTAAAAADRDDHLKLPEPEAAAAANGYSRMDPEAESPQKKESRRQKRKRMAICFVLFTLFQIAMLLVTVLVVMKIRTPQFRVRAGTFDVVNSSAVGTNPSFNITMIPNVGIKNTNFGPYKYEETTVTFFYRGVAVGSAVVHKSKVGMRSTKRTRGAAVELSSSGITGGNLGTELRNDLSSGKLPLTSQARLNGKVEMMFIIKKKKGCNMNCSMQLDIATRELHQVNCN